MSIHVTISQEAAAMLAAQKRNSTISSGIIALLIIALMGVSLSLTVLVPSFKNNEETVAYASSTQVAEEISKPELTNEVESKPSPPSSSMSKVITSAVASPIAVPVPKDTSSEPSLDFGSGDDFGDGWGASESSGAIGGSGISFFSNSVQADRVVFVIDYSLSMRGEKIALLKKELTKSIEGLPDGLQYQLIFFAGPAWVAGDKVQLVPNRSSATVINNGIKYNWINKAKNDWARKGREQKVDWLVAQDSTRTASITATEKTPLVWGTTWQDPLEMAVNMTPTPEHIFFMTDGLTGTGAKGADNTSKKIAAEASRKNIKINTIALLIPDAEDALKHMSDTTGGKYKLVRR